MYDRVGRRAIGLVAVLAITAALMKLCGSVRFAPWATNLLVRVAGMAGIHGDESIEDFYLEVSAVASLIVAIAVVLATMKLVLRPRTDRLR